MSYFKQIIVSVAFVGALASPAFAQGGGEGTMFMDETMLMATPNGAVVKKPMDKAMQEMMMKEAMPMTAGVMMMMHDGKMYMVTDKKMSNGKMMSDMVMGK